MGIKIPQYRHRVPLAGPSGAREQPDTTTAQLLIQSGQILTDVGADFLQKYETAKIEDEISSAEVGTLNEMNDFLLNLSTDPDYMTHEEKFEKELHKIKSKHSGDLKYRQSQDSYDQWVEKNAVSWRSNVAWNSSKLGVKHMEVHYLDELNTLERLGNKQALEERYKRALNQGITTHAEVDKDRLERFYKIDVATTELTARQIMAGQGIDKAKEYVYSKDTPDIAMEDRNRIEKGIQAEWDEWENRIEKEKQIASDKAQEHLWDLLRQGKTENYKRVIDNQPIEVQGPGGKLAWEKRFDGWIKADKKAREDNTKSANDKTDDGLFLDITKKILDPEIDEFEIKNDIRENTGADENGKARISASDAEKLTSWTNEHKNNPVFKQALNMFSDALGDGYINDQELAELTNDYQIKVSSGNYTPTGLIQEATNMIAEKDEEYIENELEKFRVEGKLFKHKETAEEWIARHPPEKKDRSPLPPLEEGNITDFAQWKNVESMSNDIQVVNLDGGEVFSDDYGKTWYMKYGGTWYVVDPPTGKMTPYKRENGRP